VAPTSVARGLASHRQDIRRTACWVFDAITKPIDHRQRSVGQAERVEELKRLFKP
jgi:hypothetical protein